MGKMKINFEKLIRIVFVFVMIFSLVAIPYKYVYGFSQNSEFKHIKSIDGLSHDTVYCITQDKDGFVWFGTEDGLNKFDGSKIKAYQKELDNNNSLENTNCSALFVDSSNMIWIASWGGGVEVLNPRNDKIISYVNDPSNPNSISDNNIQSIFEDSKGTLWFGTYTKGLNKFDRKTGEFKSYLYDKNNNDSLSSNRVWSINENLDGSLLIATDKGLDKFDPKTEKFTHFNNEIKNRVRTIYWDKNKNLWLGTQNGLCKFDINTREYKYYFSGTNDSTTNVIGSIYEDSKGNLWVGTSNGLNVFNRDTGIFTRFINNPEDSNSISNNDIRAIYEDNSSNIWIGTRGGGINKIDIKPPKFQYFNNIKNGGITLSNSNVTSVLQDSTGIIWVGTNNGGVNKIDLKTNKSEYLMGDIQKEENRNIKALCEDVDSIWIGSLGGLNKICKSTGEIFTYKNKPNEEGSLSNNTVLSILKDSSGTIWIGTLAGGLDQYDKAKDKFISYITDNNNPKSISSNTVNCIYEDSMKELWVGTQNGLNKFNSQSKEFTKYKYNKNNTEGISDNIVNCIYEDNMKNLWIGTQSGLDKYDRTTNKFEVYTIKEGLPNNCIHSIIQDSEGKLWISTNKGISVLNLKENKFSNYDLDDGLQGNGYNNNACAITKDGKILFCGINGLDFINISDVNKSTFVPPIVITSFKIMDKYIDFNKILQDKESIKLTYKDKLFSLEIAALDFTKPEKNQYAYKLEGFDKDWTYAGSRNYLSYTNLPSGKYVLRIKGTNSDGVWNEQGISIPITVVPPPWATNFAYAIYILLLLASTYLAIRYYTRKKEKKLEGQFQRLTMALSSTLDINEVLKRFLESFMEIVPYDKAVAVFRKTDDFNIAAVLGFGEKENIDSPINIPEIQKIIKEVNNTGLPYIYNEEIEKSWLGIPIIYNGNLEGMVILLKKSTNFYGAKESKIGNIFVAQAGFALKNASLYDELKQAMERIQSAQEQLIQSEKMAALGQLIAGIAHEINNPLGAIKASIANISSYMNQLFGSSEELFKIITEEQISTLMKLIKSSLERDNSITSSEARKYKRSISNQLEEKGIEDAYSLADSLVDMGVYGNVEEFIPLLESKDSKTILKTAYSISGLQRNSKNIKMSVERATKIIYALNNYARQGNDLQFIEADITEGIDTVLTIYDNQIKKNTEVVKNYSKIPRIMCSPDELNQVWTNIIYNGLQAMEFKGKLIIDVLTEGEYVVVRITDSGKGSLNEIKDKIFEPFFTTKPQGEGTGLGLYIVRKIILKHNGDICADSKPGKTTFTVKLPIVQNIL